MKAADFGYTYTQAVPETVKAGAEFRERVVDNCMPWLKQQVFDIICPGLAYHPEQALQTTKQVFLDSNGNETCLTMDHYTTNCLKTSECLTMSALAYRSRGGESVELSLRKEVRRNTAAALVAVPGFNAFALCNLHACWIKPSHEVCG